MSFERKRIETILKERFVEGNRVLLLHRGPETFETIFKYLEKASDIICLEFYIYRNDETGERLAEILRRKASEGVRVYVLYDHFGSFGTPRAFWKRLTRAGIEVRASHPFTWRAPGNYIKRDHKKLIIIDGEVAFTGGLNIANEYSGFHLLHHPVKLKGRKLYSWRDTGVLLKGPAAMALFEYFRKAWRLWAGDEISFVKTPPFYSDGFPVIPIFASSARGRRRMRRLLYWSIENARTDIHLTTAYFTPSLRMLSALKRAVRRGVRVRLLLPGRSDVVAAHYAARASFTRLLRYGIEIYTYSGTILHSKSYLFDTTWSVIGSANLDFQSLRKNDEGNVGILDERFGREMRRIFEDDVLMSEKIELGEWLKRPLCEKAKERFFAAFRKRL
ncbi:MAG: hypothetical protein GXO94_00085 [Nitrospirae bacterium]|nr:hypothetical protein [Nitrospirota bacterium]